MGILYAVWGALEEAITAWVVIFLAICAEIVSEYRANKAISVLSQARVISPQACVIREGIKMLISSNELVKGDIIVVKPKQIIPADAVLLHSLCLEVDESILTGESDPVEKDCSKNNASSLSKKLNMIYAGTRVHKGEALAVVVATGLETDVGKTAKYRAQLKAPKTQLELTLRSFTWRLCLFLAVLLGTLLGIGFWQGRETHELVLIVLTLAFATLPEELPLLLKGVLGVASLRLSEKNLLIKKLSTAASLGTVDIVLTDKTGTLTKNTPIVEVLGMYDRSSDGMDELDHKYLQVLVLCKFIEIVFSH